MGEKGRKPNIFARSDNFVIGGRNSSDGIAPCCKHLFLALPISYLIPHENLILLYDFLPFLVCSESPNRKMFLLGFTKIHLYNFPEFMKIFVKITCYLQIAPNLEVLCRISRAFTWVENFLSFKG